MVGRPSGIPTWAKVVIGLAIGFIILFVLVGAAGFFFVSRMVDVVSDQVSGAGSWSASTRRQDDALVADIAYDPGGKPVDPRLKLTSVTLDGAPCDKPLPAFPKNGKSVTIPFHHLFKGRSGTLSITYDDGQEQWTQSFTVEIPSKRQH